MDLKQVIVLRKDLNMRKGKMIAQGSHASLKCFLNDYLASQPSQELTEWYEGDQTKIVLYVKSEKELFSVYQEAIQSDLNAVLIEDKGYTEFDEETYTCVGIGPDRVEKIDKITSELSLL